MSEFASGDSSPPALLAIKRVDDPRGVVLALDGELDLSTVPELDRQLSDATDAKPERVLVDLSRLAFMDSTGLASIVRAHQSAQAGGSRFHLRAGPPQVQRLLQLTGLIDVFTFEE